MFEYFFHQIYSFKYYKNIFLCKKLYRHRPQVALPKKRNTSWEFWEPSRPVGDPVGNPVGNPVENHAGDLVGNPIGNPVGNPVIKNPVVGNLVQNPV